MLLAIFIILAVLMTVLALFSLRCRPVWRAVLYTLPVNLCLAAMLFVLGQQVLALIMCGCGIINLITFYLLAIRTGGEKPRPRPFKVYAGAAGVIALISLGYGAGHLFVNLEKITLNKGTFPAAATATLVALFTEYWPLCLIIGLLLLVGMITAAVLAGKEE